MQSGDKVQLTNDFCIEPNVVWIAAGVTGTVLEVQKMFRNNYEEVTTCRVVLDNGLIVSVDGRALGGDLDLSVPSRCRVPHEPHGPGPERRAASSRRRAFAGDRNRYAVSCHASQSSAEYEYGPPVLRRDVYRHSVIVHLLNQRKQVLASLACCDSHLAHPHEWESETNRGRLAGGLCDHPVPAVGIDCRGGFRHRKPYLALASAAPSVGRQGRYAISADGRPPPGKPVRHPLPGRQARQQRRYLPGLVCETDPSHLFDRPAIETTANPIGAWTPPTRREMMLGGPDFGEPLTKAPPPSHLFSAWRAWGLAGVHISANTVIGLLPPRRLSVAARRPR